jgi:hypothetical protein
MHLPKSTFPFDSFIILTGAEEEARSVVTDHRLGDSVSSIRRRSSANLQTRDAHDIGMEGLTMFWMKGLIWGCTTSSNNCHGHVELASSSSVGVSGRRQFCHSVDTKVGIH